jgi:hypothetical protein
VKRLETRCPTESRLFDIAREEQPSKTQSLNIE